MEYDVVFIHPPSNYDFRQKAIFPGPIAYTVSESTEQFMIPPVGILSIADYLDRNGYRVTVDNLCERMVSDTDFNVEEHIRNLSAKVYAIGLHWCVHSQGAIEIAKLCKNLHIGKLVILGGLTSTIFHREILHKYDFIDGVIRGEAEKPFLLFMQALEQHKKLEAVPNLTYRDEGGNVMSVPLMEPVDNLDEFEFTRLDLLKPNRTIFTPHMPPHWAIPVCRGCVYNCASCGGSAYSYKTYLGRRHPAFRSPEIIAADIKKLSEQGVQIIFLYQDPRMGGESYWHRLLTTLRREKLQITQLSMELFGPASEDYIRELSNIGVHLSLSISPESGADGIRRDHGRNYTSEELLRTIQLCKNYGITLGIHTMTALANDTPETIKENWHFGELICSINQEVKGTTPVGYAFGPMILLDPGSLAFDFPTRYGYRLLFKNFEEYIKGLSLPSWHQWISYETEAMDKSLITQSIIDSIEYSIELRERYGLYTRSEADMERLYFVNANRLIIAVVNEAMKLANEDERLKRLRTFREYLDRNIPHLESL